MYEKPRWSSSRGDGGGRLLCVRCCFTSYGSEELSNCAQKFKEHSQEFERFGFAYFGFTHHRRSPRAKICENQKLQFFQQEKEQAR